MYLLKYSVNMKKSFSIIIIIVIKNVGFLLA